MHIPDGFLTLPVALISLAISSVFIALSIRKIRNENLLTSDRISILTSLSAGIFVAQMIAWPLPGGTSLHLVGGGLAGIVMGPWLGIITMSLVLLIQCLLFHDGGITAIGANILSMGIISVLTGYTIYRLLRRFTKHFIAGVIAGWLSLTSAGIVSGTILGASWSSYLPIYIMGVWHIALGIIEGMITGSVISYLNVKAKSVLRW
ncbi:MAG: energy-coupling factor ABC transporter permease [Sulfolobales archaeon]|nr:energy-coupling factor ABC transporter permease [Sulfolobales archaeon]